MDEYFIEDNDLDWFAVFDDGRIAHFVSGGTTAIPEMIKKSIENYEIIYDYFFNLKKICDVKIIERNLPSFSDESKQEHYLRSFVDVSSKGLYSYNINFTDGNYFLVAEPLQMLLFDNLPKNIRDIIYKLPRELKSAEELIDKIQ